MKNLLLMATFFLGIGDVAHSNDQLLPTKLRITVLDGLGNFVEEATVSIYLDQENYLISKDPIQTLKTDAKGRVTFKDIEPKAYFIEAKKGDLNNNGEGVMTGVLSEGKLNKVNTVIE